MGTFTSHAHLSPLLIAVLALCGCRQEPCSELRAPEDFAACPALCGSETDTAVPCTLEVPRHPSGAWDEGHELLFDYAKEEDVFQGTWGLGYWRMGETGRGLVEILELPVFLGVPFYEMRKREGLYYPTPSNFYPPLLRAAKPSPIVNITPMNLYMHYYLARGTCVVEVASVMAWTLRDVQDHTFAEYQRASLVLAVDETCEGNGDFEGITPGFAWKTRGVIVRVGTGGGPAEPPGCETDGWCNELCVVDYDCPCHHDGVCDIFGCPGDLDCGCGQDSICVKSCGDDPDCLCIADGVCSQRCGGLDPDCNCGADGSCNCGCLQDDPDCGCLSDGACSAICGWADPDCRCAADGVCNELCEGEDPDC
jgi:hypothetical protein